MNSNIEAPPSQRVDNAASGYLGGDTGWSESNNHHIHDLYVRNSLKTIGDSPIVAPGAEEINLATSTSWATVHTAPGHASSVYQHHPGNMLPAHYSRPAAFPQFFGQDPRGAKLDGDQAPASFWVCLSGEHDQGGFSSKDYWPLLVRNGISAPGISAPMTIAHPEVQSFQWSGRKKNSLKRFRASNGNYDVDDQGGQARRIGSPHRLIKRVPVKLSDNGRTLLSGSSRCPHTRSRLDIRLKNIGAQRLMAAQVVKQDHSNYVFSYVCSDPHGDTATPRLSRDQTRPHMDENSSPTLGACSTLICDGDVIAGVAGRERATRVSAATCEATCPCRGRGLDNHDSLKVQRLSIDPVEIIADGVDKLGVKSQQATGGVSGAVPGRITGSLGVANAVRERCEVFLANESVSLTSGPWETYAFEKSQRGATGSRAEWAWPAGEHTAFWSQKRDREARAKAMDRGSLSVGTHSSSGCFTSRPGTEVPTNTVSFARPQSEPWASARLPPHTSHVQVNQRPLDRDDVPIIPDSCHRGDDNVEMDVETNGENHTRRVIEPPSGSTGAPPFGSTLSLLPDVKTVPGYGLTVTVTDRCQEGVAVNEAAMASAATAVAVVAATAEATEVFEATNTGWGDDSERVVSTGEGDTDDDSSDATTSYEEISVWLHDMEDWWTS